MKDPRLAKMMKAKAMPFDGKRIIYGGFKVMLDIYPRGPASVAETVRKVPTANPPAIVPFRP
jgi:hypothetical protein